MHWRQNNNYKEDARFITRITERIDCKLQLINDYSIFWTESYNQERQEHKKENFATRQSNIRIREMVKKVMKGKPIDNIDPPVVCGNCEHLTIENFCKVYRQPVPSEFINEENNCEKYKNGVPF